MISTPHRFDWNTIKQSLRDGEAALDRAWAADEQQLNQVYRRRHLEYAHRKTLEVAATETLRMLVFVLGAERYAVDLPAVVKVFPLSQCTPVPGDPKEIVGVINVSGEIRSVVDAAELLGLVSNGDRGEGQVILLRHSHFEVGLKVDHVEAIETIIVDLLSRPEDREDGLSIRYVEGMTPESLIVLNVRQLLSHSVFQSDPVENKGTEHDHW